MGENQLGEKETQFLERMKALLSDLSFSSGDPLPDEKLLEVMGPEMAALVTDASGKIDRDRVTQGAQFMKLLCGKFDDK